MTTNSSHVGGGFKMKIIELLIDGEVQLALTEQVGLDLWVSSKGWSYKIKNFGVNRPKVKKKL